MSYHDNKPVRAMTDDEKKIDHARKNLDPAKYGEDKAEKIAEEACDRIEKAAETIEDLGDDGGRKVVKEIIKKVVEENL